MVEIKKTKVECQEGKTEQTTVTIETVKDEG